MNDFKKTNPLIFRETEKWQKKIIPEFNSYQKSFSNICHSCGGTRRDVDNGPCRCCHGSGVWDIYKKE